MDCYSSCAAGEKAKAAGEYQLAQNAAAQARQLVLVDLPAKIDAVQNELASAEANERQALVECGRR